jgi:hypothetical protein
MRKEMFTRSFLLALMLSLPLGETLLRQQQTFHSQLFSPENKTNYRQQHLRQKSPIFSGSRPSFLRKPKQPESGANLAPPKHVTSHETSKLTFAFDGDDAADYEDDYKELEKEYAKKQWKYVNSTDADDKMEKHNCFFWCRASKNLTSVAILAAVFIIFWCYSGKKGFRVI